MATAFKGLIILGLLCKATVWGGGVSLFLLAFTGGFLFCLLFRPDGE